MASNGEAIVENKVEIMDTSEVKKEEDETITKDTEDTESAKDLKSNGDKKLFSSEDFKIEVQNLPRYFGMGQLKKLFTNKLRLNPHKLKPCGPKSNFMYICFKNEEDKQKALMVLDGFDFKGNKLKVKSIKGITDPYHKKNEFKARNEAIDNRPVAEKLQDAVCPFAREPYEDQLSKKQNEVNVLMKRLGSEISRNHDVLKQWVDVSCNEYGTVAPVSNIVRSPSTFGYRNKCEFSIGYMTVKKENGSDIGEVVEGVKEEVVDQKIISVGFRLASYKAGSVEIVGLSSLENISTTLPHISPEMVLVVTKFEQLVRASGILPYCSLEREGNWRNIMIRTSRGTEPGDNKIKQIMVVVVLDPMYMDYAKLTQLRSDLTQFFTTGSGSECGVTSLYLHLSPARKESGVPDPAPELLWGEATIQENLMGRRFSISPQAFFQVNTLAAEVLYKTVGDIADLTEKATLVDVCCGTGTIGICLAARAKNVVGVEIVAEAIRDARKNALNNGVTNCDFFTGKAEEILSNILRDIDSKEIVAVVDPPRAGLHPRALSAIRNTLTIKRLVYVSCDAKNAMKNFVDLSRPPSKTAKGDPFLPVKVIPVDLFPHSRGFELVLLFERVAWGDILNSEIAKRIRDVETESLEEMVSLAEKVKQERECNTKQEDKEEEDEMADIAEKVKQERECNAKPEDKEEEDEMADIAEKEGDDFLNRL